MFPVLCYECETWSLIVKKNRLKSYNKFGLEWKEGTGDWSKLHNDAEQFVSCQMVLA